MGIFSDTDRIIEIERTEEFYNAAKELGEFIKNLPLTSEDNDKLIEAIIKQVHAAEESGYKFGVKISAELHRQKGRLLDLFKRSDI